MESRPTILLGLGLYFAQLILCYPAAYLLLFPLSPILSALGLSGEHPGGIHFAGYAALACVFAGSLIGWVVGQVAPSLIPTGRWIWAVLDLLILSDLIRGWTHPSPLPWLPEYFFAYGGNEGLGVALFTLPASCATGYSIGMFFPKRWGRVGRPASPITVILGFTLLLTALVLAVPGLQSFEQERLDAWHRFASVIDRRGLSLSPDGETLCATQDEIAKRGLPFLRWGSHLNVLGVGSCAGGVPGQLKRVQVLDGDNAGKQGWVQSYGLSEH